MIIFFLKKMFKQKIKKVDMPVFFYVDPDFEKDIMMRDVDVITLSYTFFPAKNGPNLLPQ